MTRTTCTMLRPASWTPWECQEYGISTPAGSQWQSRETMADQSPSQTERIQRPYDNNEQQSHFTRQNSHL